jgi:hypothetical protein
MATAFNLYEVARPAKQPIHGCSTRMRHPGSRKSGEAADPLGIHYDRTLHSWGRHSSWGRSTPGSCGGAAALFERCTARDTAMTSAIRSIRKFPGMTGLIGAGLLSPWHRLPLAG